MVPPSPLPVLSQSFADLLGGLPGGLTGAALFLAVWAAASFAVVWVFKHVLHARARASKNPLDDIVAEAMRVPLYLWLLLAGVWVLATRFALLPPAWVPGARLAVVLLAALTVAYTVVRVAHGAMDLYARRRPSFRAMQGVLEFGTRLLVYAVALMMVLSYLGIEITPLLGALGIAGLAVALALQDTLANFFAGVYLSLDRPLREGDFVELDGGAFGTIKGYVMDVGWRSVRVRELSNNVFVLPNGRVASGIIKNYDLPEPELSVVPQVSVAYGSDLERVEHVTVEVARDVLRKVPGGVGGFEPFIRYHTFADSGIGFSVILRVRSFVDQYLVLHEFVKALHARFAEEGIEIPFPQRVVHVAGGDGARPGPVPPPAPGAESPRRL